MSCVRRSVLLGSTFLCVHAPARTSTWHVVKNTCETAFRFPRVVDDDLVVRFSTWRAAGPLFPGNFLSARSKRLLDEHFAGNHDWHRFESDARTARIQGILDRQQPHAQELLGRVRAGEVLPQLVIATHARPEMQASLAKVFAGPRFRHVPKVVLVNRLHVSALHDESLAEAADAVVYSFGGETNFSGSAREIMLVGGYETACLKQTLNDLAHAALERGLADIRVRVLTDHSYDYTDESRLRSIRDGHADAEIQEKTLGAVLGGWRLTAHAPGARTFTAIRRDHRMTLHLTLE